MYPFVTIITIIIMHILLSYVLYNLLPDHHPKTWDKRRLGYEAIGTTLHVHQQAD